MSLYVFLQPSSTTPQLTQPSPRSQSFSNRSPPSTSSSTPRGLSGPGEPSSSTSSSSARCALPPPPHTQRLTPSPPDSSSGTPRHARTTARSLPTTTTKRARARTRSRWWDGGFVGTTDVMHSPPYPPRTTALRTVILPPQPVPHVLISPCARECRGANSTRGPETLLPPNSGTQQREILVCFVSRSVSFPSTHHHDQSSQGQRTDRKSVV